MDPYLNTDDLGAWATTNTPLNAGDITPDQSVNNTWADIISSIGVTAQQIIGSTQGQQAYLNPATGQYSYRNPYVSASNSAMWIGIAIIAIIAYFLFRK